MKALSKIVIGVLLCILVAAIGYIYFQSTQKKPISVIPDSKKLEILTEAKLISKKIDRKGLQHTIVEETNNLLPSNLIESGYSSEFVDSLIAETDIQRSEIKALTHINQTIKQDNLQAVVVINQLKEKVYEYRDSNVSLSFKTDSINVNGLFGYQINQDLAIREYSRRKWLLGKQREMMDITSTSKFSTINKVNKISFEKYEDPFDITVTSKFTYLPKSGNAGYGGQLKVSYKNLSASYSNLYFPNSNKFVPIFSAEYKLLKF
jgi:hypothetical protein